MTDLQLGKITPNNAKCWNQDYFFRAGLTWSSLTSGAPSIRSNGSGYLFDTKGQTLFPNAKEDFLFVHAFLNSSVAALLLNALSPTLNLYGGEFSKLPVCELPLSNRSRIDELVVELIRSSKRTWDSSELSWDFERDPVVSRRDAGSLELAWSARNEELQSTAGRTKLIEEEINALFAKAYGLEEELVSDSCAEQGIVAGIDRERDCQRLISYAIGCAMGRYSLDSSGLIYAHAGNVGFDPSRYEQTLPADVDGILPITQEGWFEDDAACRLRNFLRTVWGAEKLDQNVAWLAESLGIKGNELTDEAIRRYLADKFFKDHLQIYKKRPIYWLFSSGKQGAFQALVYLHRYNEGTLARMRAEYVVPLIAMMVARLDLLDKDVAAATSAAARTKLQKQIEALRKKQIELLAYDEKLRHYADMRITLDLDDGVKVNYAKFGDLVAESKAITGGSDE